jgi:hypothetical protein
VLSAKKKEANMTSLNATEFLSHIWPQHLLTHETLELRVIDRKTQRIKREFTSSLKDFLERAKKYKDYEIYFGVATRFGNGGKKHDCYRLCTVWADLDGKTLKECLTLKPRPTIIVESGGGCHAYWQFNKPLLIRDGNGRANEIESINRGLCQRFGGDATTVDISRILRVPNTMNHKYDPPRQVKAYVLQD